MTQHAEVIPATSPLEVGRALRRQRLIALAGLGLIALLTALSAITTSFDFGACLASFPKALSWMASNFIPGPKALKALPKIVSKLGETVLVSVMATVLAAAAAFALSILSSRTTRPARACALAVRGVASFCRNVPVVAWAMIFLLSFGQNVFTGLFALFIGTLGYLTRAFTETIDDVAESSVEALRASGATWLATVTRAVVPSVLPQVASWMLYMVETNIRDATLVGILTGTGVGFLFDLYYKSMNFQAAGLVTIGLIVAVVALETLSNALRRAFL
jgi:phosphonate transport system permease protein